MNYINATKILHIITGLSMGGAETMLYKLVSNMDSIRFTNTVVSLTNRGALAVRMEASGVVVDVLGMRRGVPDPRGIWQLRRFIYKENPDIIQTWMYHADLLGGVAARMAGRVPVVWNIRHSNLDPKANKKTTLWTARACALLSRRIPFRIVCCSEASRQVHAGLGYETTKMHVIPNGFDLDAFQPDMGAVNWLRKELKLPAESLLIGMVARFNLQKDHENLVRAAKIVNDSGVKVAFVLCGQDVTWENVKLAGLIKAAGLDGRFFLLGLREDIPRITAALDIACLSSAFGEGFPNVLGEAMACEVPCIATDVGDSADIVGGTGRIVPPGNPEALAAAIRELVVMGHEGRKKLGSAARERVQGRFELGSVVQRYEKMYRSIAGSGKIGGE